MGTNKRTMKFKMAIILLVLGYFTCQAQDYDQYIIRYSLEEVDSLLHRLDSITAYNIQRDIGYFFDTGGASILLSNPSYYAKLHNYSEKIRDELFKCYKGCSGSHYNRRVLGLLELPQYMKDSLLNFKYTELEVRAGVGDTIAQNKIVKMYKEFLKLDIRTDKDLYKAFYAKKIPEAMLNYIGTKNSIELFIEGMSSSDTFEQTYFGKPYNQVSIFTVLLGSYTGLLLVNEPLVSYLYYQNRFLYAENEKVLGEGYQAWLKEVERYFKDKHGVELNIKAPYLILGYERYMVHE